MLCSCTWLGSVAAASFQLQAWQVRLGLPMAETMTRPVLHIPMVHGDVEAVHLLLAWRADAAACDSKGEPLLCQALRNVRPGRQGA